MSIENFVEMLSILLKLRIKIWFRIEERQSVFGPEQKMYYDPGFLYKNCSL